MEIELKLLAAPEVLAQIAELEPIRRLRVGEARIERLHTRYYDTPARDLARAGIALRVRRASEAWIQTLKAGGSSVGGLHERVELEWRIADASLDLSRLAETPYAALFAERRDGLQPVFETEFERVALQLEWPDGTRAELALDRGEVRGGARSDRISEVEIELIEGDARRLFDLASALADHVSLRLGYLSKAQRGDALATGCESPPTKAQAVALTPELTVAQALSRIGLSCIAQMQANEAGVLAGADSEYLHQLRVGLRRLRVLVGLFSFVAPKCAYVETAKALRALGQALNKARDWDVYIEEMLPASELPTPHADELAARAERLRAKHRAKAQKTILSPEYSKLLLQLAQRFNDPGLGQIGAAGESKRIALDAPVGELAGAVLEAYDRKLRKAGARLSEADDEMRHAARIRGKKLRYAAEFFGALYPAARVKPYVAALRDLQDVLGTLNDVAQFLRLSKKAAGRDAKDARNAVEGWADSHRTRELGRLDKRWRVFDDTPRFWS